MKKRDCVLLAGQYVKTVKCIGNTYRFVSARYKLRVPLFLTATSGRYSGWNIAVLLVSRHESLFLARGAIYAKSLFLTVKADTVYYISVFDLNQRGPMVVEPPPKSGGTINMWFSWTIDNGFLGPDIDEVWQYR